MEDNNGEHFTLGAHILTLMATASTDAENQLLQFALQHLHRICPPFDRPSSSTLIHGLWQHHRDHLDSLQAQAIDLSAVQVFFDIP